jgi:hypothetical protein
MEHEMTDAKRNAAEAQQLRYALNALQRIANGESDPRAFAVTALRHVMGPDAARALLDAPTPTLATDGELARAMVEVSKQELRAFVGGAPTQAADIATLPRFPTMLRKMWSGTEVQQWINEHVKSGNAGEAAMQRAAAELPDGFGVHVCLEKGAGWVELYGPDGERMEYEENTDGEITPRIHAAVDLIIKADNEFEELNRDPAAR